MSYACFIHCNTSAVWKIKLLKYIINVLTKSVCFPHLDFIYVNYVGQKLNIKNIPKVIFDHCSETILSEEITLKYVHMYSKIKSTGKILYLHNNGFCEQNENIIHINDKNQKLMKYLLYCLVDKWDECTNLLPAFDIVGCNYVEQFFSIHAWWSHCKHISESPIHNIKNVKSFLFQTSPRVFNICTFFREYDTYVYKRIVDERLSKKIIYCKFGSDGIGLFNQLYSLINAIITGSRFSQSVIIVSPFLCDIDTKIYKNADEIIDFTFMNDYLKKYNVFLIPSNKAKLMIKSVKFGIEGIKTFDITDHCVSKFYSDNCFYIPQTVNLNTIKGDPVQQQPKHLYVEYDLNGIQICEYYDENCMFQKHGCKIDFDKYSNINWRCLNSIYDINNCVPLFNTLLKDIVFHPNFYKIANEQNACHTKLNVIHLRNEKDATQFWNQLNMMTEDNFKTVLESKYIYLISKYFEKSTPILVLSMNTKNNVIRYLQENRYSFYFLNKNLVRGRDVNAIIDYISGIKCTNSFIGNLNPINLHGSTFTYAIVNSLPKHVKKILIDLDNINNDEVVIT